MADDERIQIRCDGPTRDAWMEAKGAFDMTHGDLAAALANFALENVDDFETFINRRRRSRRGSRRRK